MWQEAGMPFFAGFFFFYNMLISNDLQNR